MPRWGEGGGGEVDKQTVNTGRSESLVLRVFIQSRLARAHRLPPVLIHCTVYLISSSLGDYLESVFIHGDFVSGR